MFLHERSSKIDRFGNDYWRDERKVVARKEEMPRLDGDRIQRLAWPLVESRHGLLSIESEGGNASLFVLTELVYKSSRDDACYCF